MPESVSKMKYLTMLQNRYFRKGYV